MHARSQVELVLSKGYVVLLAAGLFALIVLLSTIAFSAFYSREDWSALDAFYFTIVRRAHTPHHGANPHDRARPRPAHSRC